MLKVIKKQNRKNRRPINGRGIITGVIILVLSVVLFSCAGPAGPRPGPEPAQPIKVTKDTGMAAGYKTQDPVMGDWQGNWVSSDGVESPIVAQVMALGKGEYRVNVLEEFDYRIEPISVLEGKRSGEIVTFAGTGQGGDLTGSAVVRGGKLTGSFTGQYEGKFEMKRVIRQSPALGAKPSAGAVVLLDGTSLDQWEKPKVFSGLVDLSKIIGGDNAAAYLRCSIWSGRNQEARLELGSDDGVKVWLNGQVVHANNASRGVTPGQDKVKVKLQQGWNELMLKVTNGGGGWGACVRLRGPEGEKAADISEVDTKSPGDKGTRRYLDENDDYLTVWTVSGPYRRPGKSGREIFDVAFTPEKAETGDVKWRFLSKRARERKAQWKLVNGGMEIKPGSGSIISKQKFTNYKLHIEFRTPFMPEARGQGRSNSGVYIQGRYEVQILDSYGLEGLDNECGGIYQVGAPRVNMCFPPMQWQTYDITFHSPVFNNTGKKTKNARITVIHNGVNIHDDIELPGPTAGCLDINENQPGGILLQDHGNPVQFRNIWLVEYRE